MEDSDGKSIIKRIIFPRKNTITQMKCMTAQQKNMEYEAFVLNEQCHFSGAYCNSLHCDELIHLCQMPYRLVAKEERKQDSMVEHWNEYGEKKRLEEEQNEPEEITGESGCGLCALWKLRDAKITHLKVVGRGKCVDDMAEDIRELKKALSILSQTEEELQYQVKMKQEMFQNACSKHCYYR